MKRLKVALGDSREKMEEIREARVRFRERRMKELEEAARSDEARVIDVEGKNADDGSKEGGDREFPNVRSSW